MIPSNKLFEIIKHAGEQGFNTTILGNLGTVEISMHDDEVIRYNWKDPNIKIIKTHPVVEEESTGELSLCWLKDEVEYYKNMLDISTMLQNNIVIDKIINGL